MAFRLSPLWWPVLLVASPVVLPILALKNRRFRANRRRAEAFNRNRIQKAKPLDLPQVEFLELTVLVEQKTEKGFLRAPGVSYLLRTDKGSLLFDIAFGREHPALVRNIKKLGLDLGSLDALAISHLHGDHMGGLPARKLRRVAVPSELGIPQGIPCFLPDEAQTPGLVPVLVEGSTVLAGGIASTGPLARSLFFLDYTQEQSLVVNVRGKGLVVICGCGHPTVEVILQMVRAISREPLYAVVGGLHFPVTRSRAQSRGIELQMFMGTGKPPWQRINDEDLSHTIAVLNEAGFEKALLSGHDSCDHALARFQMELNAETRVLRAGAIYRVPE